jgi:hypothetical protein
MRTCRRPSLRVRGRDEAHLDALLTAVQEHGAVPVDPSDARAGAGSR